MTKAVLLLLLTGLVLCGCGQKGSLFLPGEAPKSQTQGPFGVDTQSQDDNKASDTTPSGDVPEADDTPASSGANDSP